MHFPAKSHHINRVTVTVVCLTGLVAFLAIRLFYLHETGEALPHAFDLSATALIERVIALFRLSAVE